MLNGHRDICTIEHEYTHSYIHYIRLVPDVQSVDTGDTFVYVREYYPHSGKIGPRQKKNEKKWIIVMQNNNNYAYGYI